MPPEDHRRQPEESASAEAEAAIRAWLPAATRLSHVPLRRMTRDAWTQAVDELVSVQFPSESFFPADDIGEGFNRTASLLRMSPLLTENYMEASEQVAAMALDPDPARRFPSQSAQGVDIQAERGVRRLGGVYLPTRGSEDGLKWNVVTAMSSGQSGGTTSGTRTGSICAPSGFKSK